MRVQAEEVYSDGLTAAQQLAQQAEQQTDTALPTTQKAKKLKPSDDQFKIDYLQHLTLARLVLSAIVFRISQPWHAATLFGHESSNC
jgi:hypothetical protein